jgi:hypothetical protein
MKKLIISLFFFAVPIGGWFIIEGTLPSSVYAYRPWEALMFQTVFDMGRKFHPNVELKMTTQGELCHHTEYAVPKNEIWRTDQLGNRNDSYIKDPDVFIIGDSFVAGVAITQDSTIMNQLQSELDNQFKVYSLAPANFYKIDYYLKNNIIEKPKIVICSFGERYNPKQIKYSKYYPLNQKRKIKEFIKNNAHLTKICIYSDKVARFYSVKYLRARLSAAKGDSISGVQGSNMFFLKGENMPYLYEQLDSITETIVSYKEYCDSIGSDFIFLPMPNKETVYYDYVPFDVQPDFLYRLDSMLQERNVTTINTLHLYNEFRKSNDELLYHLDDTHWTPTAINLVAKELANMINMQTMEYANNR